MVHFVVSLLMLFSARESFGLEIYRNRLDADANVEANANQWTYLYGEDKKWIVEEIALEANGWPRLVRRNVYDLEAQARLDLQTKIANPIRSQTLPVSQQVLRGASGVALWTVTNQWSWDWELKYSEWVKTEIDKSWWKNHGLATDCADVAYSARWIFARNNGLPMANRLASGQWFTQDSVKPEWANLPTAPDWDKDQRFLAALNYMLNFVFTHTLWNDSYPIEITPESLMPGVHHLNLFGESGHTQFVHRVGTTPDEIPVLTLNSTVPRGVRDLMEFIFTNGTANSASAAFLRMRWPEFRNGAVSLKDPTTMPHYSTEQFDSNFIRAPRSQFWEEVFFRVSPSAKFELMAQKTVTQLIDLLKARIAVVENGYQVCHAHPCVEGSNDWEVWSTPTRDERIRNGIDMLDRLASFLSDQSTINRALDVPILSQGNYTFSALQLRSIFRMNLPSNDPNDDPLIRWGAHPEGVSSKMSRDLTKALHDREMHLARPHHCVNQSCLFGSPAYLAASTTHEDNVILSFAQLSGDYCAVLSDPACTDLITQLASSSVTASGQTLSVMDWFKAAQDFNSDPRLTGERRWISYTHEIPQFVSGYGGAVHAFQNLLRDGQDLYTINGASFQPMVIPTGEKLLDLDDTDGWIWTMGNGEIRARKDLASAPLRIACAQDIKSAYAHAGRLVVTDDVSVYLYEMINNQLSLRRQFNSPKFIWLQDGLLSVSEGTNMTLLDLNAGSILTLPEGSLYIDWVRRIGQDYLVNIYLDGQGWVCSKVHPNGDVDSLAATGNCIQAANDLSAGLFNIGGRVNWRTFQNGRVTTEEDVGEFNNSRDAHLIVAKGGSQDRYFCRDSSRLAEISLPPGASSFAGCNDLYLSVGYGPEDWRVFERATGREVFRSAAYIIFASPWDQEHFVISGFHLLEGISSSLVDLKRPDRYSIMTPLQVWAGSSFDRAGGLRIYRNSQSVWLKD